MSKDGLLKNKHTFMKPFSCEQGGAPYSSSGFAFMLVDCKFSEDQTTALFLFVAAANGTEGGQ